MVNRLDGLVYDRDDSGMHLHGNDIVRVDEKHKSWARFAGKPLHVTSIRGDLVFTCELDGIRAPHVLRHDLTDVIRCHEQVAGDDDD